MPAPAHSPAIRTRRRGGSLLVTCAAVVAAVVALTGPGASSAPSTDGSDGAVPPPPAQPTSADQIQNIDQVRTAIKAYYGNTKDDTTVNPVTGNTDLYTYARDGAYAQEARGLARSGKKILREEADAGTQQAIVLDVDDTSLNTYNYEIFTNFVYNPTSNAAFVNAGVFPRVPGVVGLASKAASLGYTVFFLTGRPESQRAATEENLSDVGYAFQDANVYLKDLTKPIYSSCAPSCTTIQYKSLTRQYIESQGYDIVLNAGDQYSDLKGGFADHRVKLPNPMYYLP